MICGPGGDVIIRGAMELKPRCTKHDRKEGIIASAYEQFELGKG
jgi:hypothetical protein